MYWPNVKLWRSVPSHASPHSIDQTVVDVELLKQLKLCPVLARKILSCSADHRLANRVTKRYRGYIVFRSSACFFKCGSWDQQIKWNGFAFGPLQVELIDPESGSVPWATQLWASVARRLSSSVVSLKLIITYNYWLNCYFVTGVNNIILVYSLITLYILYFIVLKASHLCLYYRWDQLLNNDHWKHAFDCCYLFVGVLQAPVW